MESKKILKDANKYVYELLLPFNKNYYYHSYGHALEVMNRAIYLAKKEWLGKKDTEILSLASLFHDTGFIVDYDKNEVIWVKLATNYLKSISYKEKNIKKVEKLILSTDQDYKEPKNIMEEIIKDADLDNLWTDDFFKKGKNLKREVEKIKGEKILNLEWYSASLDLLYNSMFYTKTQKKQRDNKKLKHIAKLEKLVTKHIRKKKIKIDI